MRGGERVLEEFCRLFPEAPIYTLLHVPGTVSSEIASHPIVTSFLQKMPAAKKRYRYYLPLFPRAIESIDLAPCDLVISCSHAVSKSIRKPKGALHLCYCFTPMRYIWDLHEDYFAKGRASSTVRIGMKKLLPSLRRWDVATASRVDGFVAISETIRDRIRRVYRRESTIIQPPVDTDFFTPAGEIRPDGPLLVVSALVPYKRVDLVIEAVRGRNERLRIVGSGPDLVKLTRMAPSNVEFLGHVDRERLREEYRGCRALVHPAFEDFGIAPVEAMACGRPVVGYREGALAETVDHGVSGLLFEEQSTASLRDSLDNLSEIPFNPSLISQSTERFARRSFIARFREYLEAERQRWSLKTSSGKTISR